MSQLTKEMLEEMDFMQVATIAGAPAPKSVDVSPAAKALLRRSRKERAIGILIGLMVGVGGVAMNEAFGEAIQTKLHDYQYGAQIAEYMQPSPVWASIEAMAAEEVNVDQTFTASSINGN
jgi:hypothetical protein